MRKQAGFTLMELLIVIALIGIISAIAIPSFMRWLPSYRLKGASSEMYSNFQFARVSAIKNREEWAVVFDAAADTYYICSSPGTDGLWATVTGGAAVENTVVKKVDLSEYLSGVSIGHGSATADVLGGAAPADDVTYADDLIKFSAKGIISAGEAATNSGQGYVYIQNSNNTSYCIGTLSSGIVTLRKWSGGGWVQ